MIALPSGTQIWITAGADLRRGFTGLRRTALSQKPHVA